MLYHYPIVVVKEKSMFWTYIPDLPGVYGVGGTKAQAKADIRKALELYFEDLVADGEPIPRSLAKIVEIDEVDVAVEA